MRARAAIEATLAAPQWRAEVSGGVVPIRIWFHEPDRVESVNGVEPAGSPADPPMRTIRVGGDLYVTDDGGWTRTTASERSLVDSHLTLLEGLLADGPCFADEGAYIVARQDPETGCGASRTARPDGLPPGSDVWVLHIDADDRVAELALGEVPGAVGSEGRDPSPTPVSDDDIGSPIHSAGGTTAVMYRFSYDDVPSITAPDR